MPEMPEQSETNTTKATTTKATPQPEREKRKPNWGIIIGVASLALTLFGYWLSTRQQPVKRLTYEVVSYGPLANVSDSVNGRLKVSFDGKPVPNANFVVVRLTNDGNQPVLAEDFKVPFTLQFGGEQKATVLDTDVTARVPADLVPTLTRRNNTVVLHPLLLNSGDSLTLKILLAGGDQKYGGSGRIVGTQLVRQDNVQPVVQVANQWSGWIMGLAAFTYGLILHYWYSRYRTAAAKLKEISRNNQDERELLEKVAQRVDAAEARIKAAELAAASHISTALLTEQPVVTATPTEAQHIPKNGTGS